MLIPFCQQGDYGFALMIQMIDGDGNSVNLANGSAVSFVLGAPDGTFTTKTGSLYQGGIQGKIYYVLQDGDLAQFGEYTIQGAISLPSGSVVTSKIGKLRVYQNITQSTPVPPSSQEIIIGNPYVDGSWKIIIAGTELQFQRRESGAWVEKGAMEP